MKRIALARAKGGVSIAHVKHAHLFGKQAALPVDELHELQRACEYLPESELEELEAQFVKGATVKLVIGRYERELKVERSADDVIEEHGRELIVAHLDDESLPIFTHFVLVELADLPPRDENRNAWRLERDKVIV